MKRWHYVGGDVLLVAVPAGAWIVGGWRSQDWRLVICAGSLGLLAASAVVSRYVFYRAGFWRGLHQLSHAIAQEDSGALLLLTIERPNPWDDLSALNEQHDERPPPP